MTSTDEAMVRMRDGARLATDVYLPDGPGPFPTILTRTPYDKSARRSMIAASAAIFNDRGYALVAQDTRGKHDSEGELFAFVAETRDGHDTLEWLSSTRWCNGRIGMFGDSYCGFTQWAAAASRHPALQAIAPGNTAARIDSWFYRQGVFELAFALSWAASTWVQRTHREVEAFDLDWSVRPLSEIVPAFMGGADSPSLRHWLATPSGERFWTRGIYGGSDPLRGSTVPALHAGGWWDLFRHAQVSDWVRARAASPAPRWLTMDATDHGFFEWSVNPPGFPSEDWWGGEEALAQLPEQLAPSLELYDRVLRYVEGDEPAPIRWRLTQVGWQESRSWPPEGATAVCLHLAGGAAGEGGSATTGTLSDEADSHGGWRTWVHDPNALVPSRERTPYILLAEPPEDAALQGRGDVLGFTSEPLHAPLHLCGPVIAELELGSSAPLMHAIVRLLDVSEGRVTRRICDGAAAVELVGGEARVAVALGDAGYMVPAGARLCVQIASSDFPRYLPYPGDGRDPWQATDGVRNAQRLRVGGTRGSRLWLTVIGEAATT